MQYTLLRTKDNADGQFNASIGASDTSIVLKAGEGAEFPQPITGSATSAGNSKTLNSTGIQAAGVAVGDFIENLTDGSHAFVVSVSTNSVTTTELKGGTGNTWDNSDSWAVKRFVVTLNKRNAAGDITASEKVLIGGRSTDTLTVATGGRGHDGSSAQSFGVDDYVSLFAISLHSESVQDAISELAQDIQTLEDNKATETYADNKVDDTAYGAGWNGDTDTAPSKNAVYDKIETLGEPSDEAYNESTWNGDTDAPTKNAVRDEIEYIRSSFYTLTEIYKVVTSTNALIGKTGTIQTTSTSYVKVYEYTIAFAGTYTTRINFNNNGAGGAVRIYKDDVAYGTERTTEHTNHDEDLAFAVGEKAQVYMKATTATSTLQTFSLMGDIILNTDTVTIANKTYP